MPRGTAWRRRTTRILARSHAIPNEKFCGREIFSKISVRNPLRIARNLTRRTMPTLGTVFGDLHASRQGVASSGKAHFGEISRDDPNAKFCGRENFSKISVRNPLRTARNFTRRTNDADARHNVWGPSCLAARLGVVGQRGFRRDLARFRTQNFAAAKIF